MLNYPFIISHVKFFPLIIGESRGTASKRYKTLLYIPIYPQLGLVLSFSHVFAKKCPHQGLAPSLLSMIPQRSLCPPTPNGKSWIRPS